MVPVFVFGQDNAPLHTSFNTILTVQKRMSLEIINEVIPIKQYDKPKHIDLQRYYFLTVSRYCLANYQRVPTLPSDIFVTPTLRQDINKSVPSK